MQPQEPQQQPKKRRTIWVIVGVVVVLCLCLTIIGAMNSGNSNNQGTAVAPVVERAQGVDQASSPPAASEPTQSPRPTKTPRPEATAKPTATPLAKVGDAVVLENVTFRVVSAENTGNTFKSEEYPTPLESSGKFILLKVEITNTGTDPLSLVTPGLLDSAGREYNTHENGWIYLPSDQQCILDTLNPGLTKTCASLFELPSDATGLLAVLKSSLFDKGVQISLDQ